MFSLVYVLLAFDEQSPAEAIRASLAPSKRGGRGDLPDDRLTFHDDTDHVRSLHEGRFTFSRLPNGGGTRIEGGDVTYLDLPVIEAEMAAREVERWTVRLADLEPDLAAFADHYVRQLERHPISGGYGLWLNPLGRWDWWDLGGRFDGRIVADRRRPGRTASLVSSGQSRGREVLSGIESTLTKALGAEPPAELVVEADNNIELVSRLLEDARDGREHAFPGALLLPPGAVEDERRWLRSWPEIEPAATLAWLDLPPSAGWKQVVGAAYERFPDHWAAGVAYHL